MICLLVLALLAVLAALALTKKLTQALDEANTVLQEKEDAAVMHVRYVVPGQDDIVDEVSYGDTAVLHRPVSPKGLTFLCWENENGLPETQSSFPVYGDRVFRGRYALHFETNAHLPYLHTDGDGIVRAESPVTRREFVCVLHTLLNTDLEGKGTFLDVPEEDECHDAAAVLKDLEVLSGSQLHPDAALTRGEMIRMLCSFFPASGDSAVFQDLTEEDALYPCYCTAVSNWARFSMSPRPASGMTTLPRRSSPTGIGKTKRPVSSIGSRASPCRCGSPASSFRGCACTASTTTIPPRSTDVSTAWTSTAAAKSPAATRNWTGRSSPFWRRPSTPPR